MNDRPPVPPELYDEMHRLVTASLSGDMSPEQGSRLEELIRQDLGACDLYLNLVHEWSMLLTWAQHRGPANADTVNRALPGFPMAPPMAPVETAARIPTFAPTIFPSVAGFVSSGWPVAYLVATVVLALALLIGSLVHVSEPVQVASHSVLPSTSGRGAGGEGSDSAADSRPTVGQITGMVDCRFAEGSGFRVQGSGLPSPTGRGAGGEGSVLPKTQDLRPKTLVCLGDCFALASGLLEITYNTGARVILQGPVTYEVEAKDGGYLSLGKLTAKVQKSEIRDPKSEIISKSPNLQISKSQLPKTQDPRPKTADPSSLISHPLFSIRTPTATVTDLGTEFGVEVTKQGHTASYVFRGTVEVRPFTRTGGQAGSIRLGENESARVEQRQEDKAPKVYRAVVDPATFVRCEQIPKLAEQQRLNPFRRWQAYSQRLRRDPSLVAYYDFQQKPGLPALLPNVAANGDSSLDGIVENATWSNGRMPGKHALRFNGIDEHVQINVPQKVDDVTLAAWVCVESLHDLCNSLLMSDGWPKAGALHWQVRAADGAVGLGINQSKVHFYQALPAFDRRHLSLWRHLAVVYDHAAARVKLYVDGQVTDEAPIETHAPICLGPAWIGHWNSGNFTDTSLVRNLHGKIDELAVFGRPLKAEEIQRMFEEGGASIGESRSMTTSVRPDQPQRHDLEKR